jgi:hypothetical protein
VGGGGARNDTLTVGLPRPGEGAEGA